MFYRFYISFRRIIALFLLFTFYPLMFTLSAQSLDYYDEYVDIGNRDDINIFNEDSSFIIDNIYVPTLLKNT